MAALSYDLGQCCNYEKQRFGATTVEGKNEEEVRDRQQREGGILVVGELHNFPLH